MTHGEVAVSPATSARVAASPTAWTIAITSPMIGIAVDQFLGGLLGEQLLGQLRAKNGPAHGAEEDLGDDAAEAEEDAPEVVDVVPAVGDVDVRCATGADGDGRRLGSRSGPSS